MRDGRPAAVTGGSRHAPPRWEFALFGGSTLLFQASRFLYSLVAASMLRPADFSTWAIIVTLLVYCPSLALGVINGMSRELPLLMGRGSRTEADRTRRATWVVSLSAAGLAVAASLAAAWIMPTLGATAPIVGGLVAGTIVYTTQQFELRSRLRFVQASAQQGTFGILALLAVGLQLVSAGAASLGAVAGLYGAALFGSIALGIALSPIPLPRRVDFREIQRLGSIGFPIMVAGLVFSVFVTLDRWLAVALLGPIAAAPYALASITAAAMLVLPSVVSQQTYPRMAIERGAGAPVCALRGMARRQGRLAAAAVAPVAVLVSAGAAVGVPALVPGYSEAVPAIVILALGFTVLAYHTGYGNYLIVVGAQWRYLSAQLVGVAVALGLMVAGGLVMGIVGIALGMSISHVVYGLTLRAVAERTDEPLGRPAGGRG